MYLVSDRPEVTSVLPPVLTTAEYPCYVGLATTSLAGRLRRYRQSLADLKAFDADDLYVSVIPCSSPAWAAYTEIATIELLGTPLLNRVGGWGAKARGAKRAQQRPNGVDCLWPARAWTTPPSIADQIRVRLKVL